MLLNRLEFFLMNNPLRGLLQEKVEIPRMKNFVDVPMNSKVLEIGCGVGRGIQLIQKQLLLNEVTGVDLDPKMIELANQKNYGGKVDLLVADVTSLPLSDNSFEAVFDFGIIHHVPDWKKAIEQIVRVTRPGGLLVLEDLSIETFGSPIGKIARKILAHPYDQMYTQVQFVSYLKQMGTIILAEKTFTNLGLLSYFLVVARKNSPQENNL